MTEQKPKPITKTVTYYDYHDCADYIEWILGYDLRDVLGKFKNGKVNNVEYLDFWHFLIDGMEMTRAGIHMLPTAGKEEWQNKILEVFHNEFGKDAEYLFDW